METRELLLQLTKLEKGLKHFSFKELKTNDATVLKKSFNNFKEGLEAKVFGEDVMEKDGIDLSALDPSEIKMMAKLSHDIRTPLNGIMGFVDLLKETPLNPAQEEITQALTTASNHLMNTVNELLEFSKLASGQEKFEEVTFNIHNLVNELSFLCKTLIVDKDIQFVAEVDSVIPNTLVGDPSKLSQVLLNLLGNAIKFVEKGEISLRVRPKEHIDKEILLQFIVSDTGIGIANERIKQIFESFQQAEADTYLKHGRSGLGLGMVKQIVTKLGGDIRLESELGQGTTVIFELPYKIHNAKPQSVIEPLTKSNGHSLPKEAQVLVMEENALSQRLLQTQLDSWGCMAKIVENGVEGMHVLEEGGIDLVILDLGIPVFDGFEIAKKIRNHPSERINNVPLIAISADFTTTDRIRCEKIGIDDFILKPYNPMELMNKVQLHLEEKHRGPQYNEPERNGVIQLKPLKKEALIDLDPIYGECMGQMELLEELLRLFRGNILEFLGKIKIYLQSRNYQGIDFASNKIKSSLKMLQADKCVQLCKQLSLVSKTTKDLTVLEELYQQFVELYPIIDAQIQEKLGALKKYE